MSIKQFTGCIYSYFQSLIEIYGFKIKNEIIDKQSYVIEYCSENIVIKLEKYRQEFYVTLYKLNNPEKEINIFNLIDYLNKSKSDVPKEEYFKDEKNINECYRKQLHYLSTLIYNNYQVISDFFNSDDYDYKVADLEKFLIKKYPDLFKTDSPAPDL